MALSRRYHLTCDADGCTSELIRSGEVTEERLRRLAAQRGWAISGDPDHELPQAFCDRHARLRAV